MQIYSGFFQIPGFVQNVLVLPFFFFGRNVRQNNNLANFLLVTQALIYIMCYLHNTVFYDFKWSTSRGQDATRSRARVRISSWMHDCCVMFIIVSLISSWSFGLCFNPLSHDFLLHWFFLLHEQTCASSYHRLSQTPSPTSLTKIPTCKTRASALPLPRPNSTCSYNKTSSLVEADGPRPFSTGPQDSLSINRSIEKVRKGLSCFVKFWPKGGVRTVGLHKAYTGPLWQVS